MKTGLTEFRMRKVLSVAALMLVLGGGAAGAQSSRGVPGPQDYEQFSRFITTRNIFDPNRYPHEPGHVYNHIPRPPSVRAPAFSFVGAMRYSKGLFAFFDGNGVEYRKALQVMDTNTIAGFTVQEITLDSVTLVGGGRTNVLQVGFEMRQEYDGSWVATGESQGFGDNSASSSASSSSDSGGASTAPTSTSGGGSSPAPTPGAPMSDVLKRLMQLRQQETK